MTPAIITPLRSGEAVLDLDGVPAKFSSWRAAADEADAQRRPWLLERFPAPRVERPV
jgi:hypothetical protein